MRTIDSGPKRSTQPQHPIQIDEVALNYNRARARDPGWVARSAWTARTSPAADPAAWRKMRINQGQEFVIGGYTLGGKNFDAVICGYFENGQLVHVARTRNGFTPSSRQQLYRRFRGLEIVECPFANLPEARSGRWGQGLTADKMKECRWLLCRIRHSAERF